MNCKFCKRFSLATAVEGLKELFGDDKIERFISKLTLTLANKECGGLFIYAKIKSNYGILIDPGQPSLPSEATIA